VILGRCESSDSSLETIDWLDACVCVINKQTTMRGLASSVIFFFAAACLLAIASLRDSTVSPSAALQRENGRNWEPSLGFYVKRGRAIQHARLNTHAYPEAVKLSQLLMHSSPRHVKSFMAAFDREAQKAGGSAPATEEYLSAMWVYVVCVCAVRI